MRKIINISVPDATKRYVERRVAEEHFGSVSEYFRDLIRHDQKRSRSYNQSVARNRFLSQQDPKAESCGGHESS
jgi:antitoxin ParD1/3/4